MNFTTITTTGNAGNTWGKASEFTAKFGRESGVILVNDAIHTPRAMKLFSEFGLKPYAAPTNFTSRLLSSDSFYRWLPSTSNINIMANAMHELASLLFYKLFLSGNSNNNSRERL